MNRNDQCKNNDASFKHAASTPATGQAANDATSGKSASGREAQQGTGSGTKSQQEASRKDVRSDGGASR